MFGAKVVGEAKARELREKHIDGAGGGAIQFGTAVLGTPQVATVPAVAPEKVGKYSEKRAVDVLRGDPNLWDKILLAEMARPEYKTQGARPVVARALLQAGELAKAKAMPGPVMEELRVMAREA